MDFADSPQEAAFRAEARAWLEGNAPRFSGPVRSESEGLARAKAWQGAKAGAGWACIRWPREYGGRGGSAMEEIVFGQEESRFDLPSGFLGIGLHTCAGAILACATEEQKRRYLPPLARGEKVWCQLFSEPGAGSDLAGLRTRAERDGDEWVVSGQKVWNSGAHYADWAILVARCDAALPKHKGLVFFALDMKTPGVEARPIRQIPGTAEFNETFLERVRIPDQNRIGEVGGGWQVAVATLANERFGSFSMKPDFADLFAAARDLDVNGERAIDRGEVRARLADWYVQAEGVRLTHVRALTALSRGRQVGPEASISKVVAAAQCQDIASFGADLFEEAGILTGSDAAAGGLFPHGLLNSPGMRIAAGTDEILRNIIAERVLGLPGDIRVDRDRAFQEIPQAPR
ncbi:MAG TPA: acyl-CoA dehydrogenase family protein [Thermoanaerobaculia bacterium]|nr:acyl-CoA dehydrogenase family protein [Thermoanaerobaculia bacterium]